jgi:hypothetical protein
MYGSTNWIVRESDAAQPRPAPVCLLDGTNVLMRPTNEEQIRLNLPPDVHAVFRMLAQPKRDVMVLADGRELTINSLPTGLVMDILVVPGSEKLSTMLEERGADEVETITAPTFVV